MPKRYRDTEVWSKPWFRKLSAPGKVAWDYLLDNCDNVGVWVPDTEAAEFFIGSAVDWDTFRAAANGNVEVLSNGKWWLVDFCCFQHPDMLTGTNNAVMSYWRLADSHGLSERIRERFTVCGLTSKGGPGEVQGKDTPGHQGKGKGMGKGKGIGISYDFATRKWSGIEQADLAGWKTAFPACNIDRELAAAGEWLLANPLKRKVNYRRFITNWLARSQEKGGGLPSRKPGSAPAAVTYPVCECGKVTTSRRSGARGGLWIYVCSCGKTVEAQ